MPDQAKDGGNRTPAVVVMVVVAMALHLVPLGFWLHAVLPMMPAPFRSASFALYLLARLFGLLGFVLMFCQFALASRIAFFEAILERPMLLKQHRIWGKIGFLLILAHGALLLSLDAFLFPAKILGLVALVLLAIAVVAAWFCKPLQLRFTTWRRMHLAAFLVFPLVIIHALVLGSTVTSYRLLHALFVVLFILYFAIVSHRAYRLAARK